MKPIAALLVAAAFIVATSGIARRDAQDAEITAKHVREASDRKADLRPCDGLWIRHGEARFRGAVQCAPGADLTKSRRLPNRILTSPIQ